MKDSLNKVRETLRKKHTGKILARLVSIFSAFVVFITTYALILPAITLELNATCGIEEHQHGDECYEERLICGQEESDGHHHDDSCYEVSWELDCEIPEHQHSADNGCFDADGNLICELSEHVHGDSCYREVKTLVCGMEESDGHHHTDACYEKVLVCGKEVHTHSEACYKNEGSEESEDAASSAQSDTEQVELTSETQSAETDETAAAAEEAVYAEPYIPELDPLNMEAVLTKNTDFYYFHAEEGEEIPADSAFIYDWRPIEKDTELASTDLVKMYLAYSIPAGSLNETNPTARYRLPENIHLTDDQIDAINKNENGITAGFSESDPEYRKYLGAEAVEGDRAPDELLQDGALEYISAVVRAENVYEDGSYLGQDLIFTFIPYTIEKNQTTYDAEQNPLSAGETVTGWFACDFNLDQIDWEEEETIQEVIPEEDESDLADASDSDIDPENETGEEETGQDAAPEDEDELTKDESAEDVLAEDLPAEESVQAAEEGETAETLPAVKKAEKTIIKTADVIFAEKNERENIKEIRRSLKQVEKTIIDLPAEDSQEDTQEEEVQEFKSGTLTAEGDGYRIRLDYTEDAKIPEGAALSVREITAETDEEAYESCLEQAREHVSESGDERTEIDTQASRFFDIEIIVTEEDGTSRKIEPAAPVSVNIQIEDAPADSSDSADASKEAQNTDPTVLHFAEDGVEQIESASDSGQKDDAASEGGETTEISFEAESFSIYGVVYTVDFHWEYNGKVYEFSLAGGSSVSFRELAEMLHLVPEGTGEAGSAAAGGEGTGTDVSSEGNEGSETGSDTDALDKFLEDIDMIRFSDESLVQVVRITEDTTAGALKETLGVESEYSAELSEKQIEWLNGKEFKAPDWALISLKAFESEEYLTVWMKDGESFRILVTDAQLRKNVLTSSGSTYVVIATYGDDAMIPEDAELRVREIAEDEDAYSKVRQDIMDGPAENLEEIPSHPVLFDISIWSGDQEIEPAEGSEVLVEVKFVGDAVKGMYTDEDSPLLINDMPLIDDQAEMDKQLQVIHLADDDGAEAVETEDAITPEEIASSFTTDSFSNWLLYLDESLTSINVTTSDSVTLRPYTSWVWKHSDEPTEPIDYTNGQWTFPTDTWDTWTRNEGGVNYTYYRHKTNGSVFRSFSKTDDQLHETYTVVTSESLSTTNGGFDLTTNKGKTIHVNVTQGTSSPKPGTVSGVSGLTVNLFDYDVPYQKNQYGYNIANTYDFTKSGPLDVQSNVASNPNSNNNINTSHDLKFIGYGGSNSNNNGGVNNYTNDNPHQGIVQNDLAENGYPTLVTGTHQNLSYLFDTTSQNHNVYAFPNADGLFQRDNQGYYYYNSNVNYAEYDSDTNRFVLYEHTYSQNTGGSNGANAKPIGFFPFHEYDTHNTQPEMNFNSDLNHHFGMSMEVDFEIPKDRKAADDTGYKHDIIYEFSGDDDLWVFVDGKLVLDIGGIHQPVTGTINFTTGVISVHGVADKTMTFDVGSHNLKMFYMERGGCDSNLSVRFNLPLIIGKGNMRIAKMSSANDISNANSYLRGAIFGIWETPDCTGEPYSVATSDKNGIVFKNLPIREAGQKYYLKEISPPEGYLLDNTVYTLTANGTDANGDYTFDLSANGQSITDFDGTYHYPIIRNQLQQPVKVEVKKRWENADGTPKDDESLQNLTAKFAVKRFRSYYEDPFLTVNLVSDQGNVSFDTISAFEHDVLTIKYIHAPDGNGRTAQGTANGTNVLTLPTNNTGSEISVTYTVNAAHAVNGEINIVIPEWFTRYCAGSGYAGKNPEFDGIQCPARNTQREEDPDFEREITVSEQTDWSGVIENLTVQEKIDGVVYHYEYYVTEKDIPEGFEAIFLDSDGNPISDPSSQSSNNDLEQDVINRELLDIPIEKHWGDFSGTMYTWTATFQLEQMEVKVDPNAEDAQDVITDFEPIPGKVMTIQKGQTPVPKFTDLPMYRVHDNGTVYRILYSVEEIGYTVERIGSDGTTIVVQWGKDANGNTLEIIGDKRFEAQFDQDAGENGSGIDDYIIKVANVLKDYHLSKEIDLSVLKTWPDGSDYASDPDAYASFVLKRTVHQEYRDYSNTDINTHWVTITLQTWQNNTSAIQTATVPEGTTVHILGSILPKTNANYIAFSQSSDQEPLTLVSDNSNSSQALPFDITVVADQDKTISLTRGDNFVVGGRDGFRLADYGNRNQDRPDVEFGELLPDGSHGVPFTLNMANQWGTGFQYLPVIEETKIDPKTGAQTIYVYSYYIEETDCNPKDFYPVFRDSSGAMVGDANSPIEYTTQLTAENVRKTIDVTLKKVSSDHLDDATEPPTLTGASFQLEKYTAKTFVERDTTWGNNGVMFLSDDDEDGIFTFEGLSTGYYKVVEVSVPAGYVKLSEDPTFEVRLNADELEVILLNSDGTDADNNQTDMLRVNELIIRYGNPPGAALPNAGGPGTRAFTILGSILILGAGVLLWRRRRLI